MHIIKSHHMIAVSFSKMKSVNLKRLMSMKTKRLKQVVLLSEANL